LVGPYRTLAKLGRCTISIRGMRFDELWAAKTPTAAASRILLTPTSWLYAFGWQVYASVYRLGLKRAAEPHKPILCVGNLVVGGSGKTPATLAIAGLLQSMGESVVVGMSGYGSPHSEAAAVAPQGPLDAAEWGDEPAMVRWLAPEVPLIVGRRRVLAAELATKHFPGSVLLMDDGFQHLPLRKHLTLLIDPANPPNVRCLPAGPYREPRSNRCNADLVFGDKFAIERKPLRFVDPAGKPSDAPKTANMLCAIGSPESFAESLAEAGVSVAGQVRGPDHDPLTAGNLFDGLDRSTALVVTAKDWVKLRSRSDLDERPILIALQDASIEPEADFRTWLGERLAQIRDS